MLSRYSRLFVVSAFMLSGANAQAALINVIEENVTLHTEVGYGYYPGTYSSHYSGSMTNNVQVLSAAVLVAGQDADENDIITGSADADSSSDNAAYVFARTSGQAVGRNISYEVSNNSTEYFWVDGADDIFDSVFAISSTSFAMTFEVLDGDSEVAIDIAELELSPNAFVTGEFMLRNLTTGEILEDVFAEDGFGGYYTLFENNTYQIEMSIYNSSIGDSGSAIWAGFADDLVFSVPEPSTLSLFLACAIAGLGGLRKREQ